MTTTEPKQSDSSGADHHLDDTAERRQVRDAMDRLLEGRPLHSDGKLTIKSLAAEARVKRWLLTHKHTDLQAEFRARVEAQGQQPAAVKALQAENTSLRGRIADLSQRLTTEQATVKRLERVVNILTLQLDEARDEQPGGSPVRLVSSSPSPESG